MKTGNRELLLGIFFSLLLHLLILLFFPVFIRRDRDDQSPVPSSPLVVSLQVRRDLNIGEIKDSPDSLSPLQAGQNSPEKDQVSPLSRKEPNSETSLEKPAPEPVNTDPASQSGLMEKSLSGEMPLLDDPAHSNLSDSEFLMKAEGTEDLPSIKHESFDKESWLSFSRGINHPERAEEEDNISLESFLRDLQETIGRDLIYPPAARNRGVEGRIILEVWVGKDGSLKAAGIRESSGSSILDRSALRLIRSLFPRNHNLDREFKITLSIEYRLSS